MIETLNKHLNKNLLNDKFKKQYEAESERIDLLLKIHNEREKSGMTQAEVAKKANITQQQMSKVENGENCNLSTFIKVCKALGLEIVFRKPYDALGGYVAETKAEYNAEPSEKGKRQI
ncbi:MAG TPA: helix-turn-helix transcriptional regulator [Clostridiales bacterium]|nr:helix-turn-helix transcriptional regulator [Clostridiales bacterium]